MNELIKINSFELENVKRVKAREKKWATRFEFITFLILACYVTSNVAFWIYIGRVFFGG